MGILGTRERASPIFLENIFAQISFSAHAVRSRNVTDVAKTPKCLEVVLRTHFDFPESILINKLVDYAKKTSRTKQKVVFLVFDS
jgi:hypothetical protein